MDKTEKKSAVKKPVTKGVAKVPMVMQLETLECGAAALAMVLAYYDKWLPLEQLRTDCGVSRDGSKAKNILLAARTHGLIAKGYRFEPEDLKTRGKFPCIVHWNFNHFVVLNGFKGNKAVLNDPARGTYAVSMEEFDAGFTGICLMFEPSESFTPEGRPKSVLSFARDRLKGTRAAVIFVLLTGIISSLSGIINPVFLRIFIDRLLSGQNPEWFIPFIVTLIIFDIIQLVVAWINAFFSLKINGKMDAIGTSTYMWKVLRLPIEFFSQRMAADIQQRQRSNAQIASKLVNTFAPLILQSIMMVFYLVVMLRYSVLLSVIGLLTVFVNIFFSSYISQRRVNISRIQMRDSGKLAATSVAGIEMIETIKVSGAENGFFEKWSGYQASVNSQQIRFEKLNQYFGMLPALITALCNNAVLMIGVYLTIRGDFTIGMITAFQGFLNAFATPANTMISAGQSLQELRSTMERVEDVMKYPTDVNYDLSAVLDEEKDYSKLRGNIELKNICFGYSKLEEPLISDFNLSIKTGQRIALVGGSGCGKSTIAKLVAGLYHPWSGEILYDGKTINQIDHEVFTGSLAVVDQDIVLFEDTIANNIKMWDESIEDFEMILAARDAMLHEDIMQREGGYQYKLTENGKDFSGGQRQRMEIARVLAQDPTMIILDEATSSLDAKTEYEVVKAIKNRGITCLVVAHRLSTIRDCDEIIVLERGKIVERGSHEQLMASCGMYKDLIANE